MKIADLHTHHPLCRHADGNPIEYVEAAQNAGLLGIGFSDHNPMPESDFDSWRMDLSQLKTYLEDIQDVKRRAAPYPVWLGLECDYIPGYEDWIAHLAEQAPWDYLIGSVHYIEPGWDVDNPDMQDRLDGGNRERIWQSYTDLMVRSIRSGLFDLIAHPDLPKKFGHHPPDDRRRYYEPIVKAAQEWDVTIELNTAGLRKPVGEMYPHREFLELMKTAGVKLAINSDAHRPEDVGADFQDAIELARELGFTTLRRFEQRQAIDYPLP
ncbi:MAG: histidinol-phosphatase HisJ family protein [Verrucomicrobiales bacterium]